MPDSTRLPFAASTLGARYDGLRLPVCALLENVRSLYNVGSFFRTADAAGLERLYLSGITAHPPRKEISKTALGAEAQMPWTPVADARLQLDELHAAGYEIAAIETSPHAVDLFDWRPRFPVCVLFGHEVEGLPTPLLDRCDTRVRIPMLGLKHSLNVSTAAGIVFYDLLRKYRDLPRV